MKNLPKYSSIIFITVAFFSILFGIATGFFIKGIISKKANSSNKMNAQYTCPKTEYVDCMPGPDKNNSQTCSNEFLRWAEKNCSNFKGAAY